MRTKDRLATGLALALTAAAVVQQLRLPRGDRPWRGQVVGVPYDFRPPTLTRLRGAVWNPEDPRLFTEHPLGLGWSVNLGRFAEPRTRAGRRQRRRAVQAAHRTVAR